MVAGDCGKDPAMFVPVVSVVVGAPGAAPGNVKFVVVSTAVFVAIGGGVSPGAAIDDVAALVCPS